MVLLMTNIELASHLELFSGEVNKDWYSVDYGSILRESAIRLRSIPFREDPVWNHGYGLKGDTGSYRGFDIVIDNDFNYKDMYLLKISKGPIMYCMSWVDGSLDDVRKKAIEYIDIEYIDKECAK